MSQAEIGVVHTYEQEFPEEPLGQVRTQPMDPDHIHHAELSYQNQ